MTDPTQASAARLTAIAKLGYHATNSLEVSNQIVNLALEQAAPDAYTVPAFDARTQRIVQGLVLDALDALLAQIDTLRQDLDAARAALEKARHHLVQAGWPDAEAPEETD